MFLILIICNSKKMNNLSKLFIVVILSFASCLFVGFLADKLFDFRCYQPLMFTAMLLSAIMFFTKKDKKA